MNLTRNPLLEKLKSQCEILTDEFGILLIFLCGEAVEKIILWFAEPTSRAPCSDLEAGEGKQTGT